MTAYAPVAALHRGDAAVLEHHDLIGMTDRAEPVRHQEARATREQPRERRWRMRAVGPGRYAGTMSEAKGPVTVEEIGDRFRFRFRMEGSVFVEQWLTPMPDGRSARSVVTIRKYGIKVGSSDAVIRKLD